MKYFFYILQCSDNTLYCGYTNNLKRRLSQHNIGIGAKYTAARCPVKMVHIEQFDTQRAAMRREKEVKKWRREKKINLINQGEVA